jgi:hypothetical protein
LGGDVYGIDFDLAVPPGNIISGHVSDEASGVGLPEVHLSLFDNDGNHIAEVGTDAYGNYYFSGWPDSTYRVFAHSVPQGYQQELYDNVPCDWDCAFSNSGPGTPISVSGSIEFPNNDIALTYTGGERIIVTVEHSGTGVPISDASAQMLFSLYDENGNWLDNLGSDLGMREFYVAPGNYYVTVQADVQYHNTIDEVFDNQHCYGFDDCWPLVQPGATLITVNPGGTEVAAFVLEQASTISGTVTALSGGALLANIEVCAQRQSDGWWGGCASTDSNGDYEIRGLEGRNNWDVFVNYTSGQPYSTASYSFNPVDNSTSNATGIDFALGDAHLVSGTLTVNDGSHSPVVREGAVNIYDASGNWVNGTDVDDNGNWSVYLGDGDYFISFETWGTYEFYVSELHDGTQCPWYSCYGGDWVNNTTPLTIDGSWVNPLDVELDQGVIFTGTLTDELPPNDPISNLRVYFYDDDLFAAGASLEESFVLLIRGDAGGNYRTPALPIRNILPFSTGWDLGYGREFYDDQKCDPMDCDDAFANRTAFVSGDDFVAGDTVTVDFDLIRRSALSGVVTDGATGIEGVKVNVWDTKSNLVDTAWTDGSGAYESNVGGHNHAAALYYVTANGENMGYVGQIYGDPANADSNAPCPQEYCVQGGIPGVTPISTLDGLDRSDINFTLAAQQPATISGVVLDQFDNPGPGGVVLFVNNQGDWGGVGWVYGG